MVRGAGSLVLCWLDPQCNVRDNGSKRLSNGFKKGPLSPQIELDASFRGWDRLGEWAEGKNIKN